MPILRWTRPARYAATVLLLSLLVACQTSPPVQEMSDARQAIAVAKEAGAAEYADDKLADAQKYLDEAQRQINEHSYTSARRNAMNAKRSAMAAQTAAEQHKSGDKQ